MNNSPESQMELTFGDFQGQKMLENLSLNRPQSSLHYIKHVNYFNYILLLYRCLQSVGLALRDLIHSVDEILPTLHESIRTEVTVTGQSPHHVSSLAF